MTVLLKKIMTDLTRLTKEDQDSLATLIREELQWKTTQRKSKPSLAKLAREARTEHLEKEAKEKQQ